MTRYSMQAKYKMNTEKSKKKTPKILCWHEQKSAASTQKSRIALGYSTLTSNAV